MVTEEEQGQHVEDETGPEAQADERRDGGDSAPEDGSAEERTQQETASGEAAGSQSADAEEGSRLKRTAMGAAVGAAAGGAVVAGRDFLAAGGAEKVKEAASTVGEKAKEKLPGKSGQGTGETSQEKTEAGDDDAS